MLQFIFSIIRDFKQQEKGGVLVFIGLSLVPILLVMGLAIDTSVGLGQKRQLQSAVDAAAKAAAANISGDTGIMTAQAQKVFTANTSRLAKITGPSIAVNSANNTVTVTASVEVTNSFMGLAGIRTSTYNATSTIPITGNKLAEVAIVYEVSKRFSNNNFHKNVCNALIDFVNKLPSNVLVSITPVATEIMLDSNTAASNNLFSLLSPTTNDESAFPALYPLASSYSWTSSNYNTVANLLYVNGEYAVYPTDPLVLMSNPVPGTCPGGYPSCAPLTWPTVCPANSSKTQTSKNSKDDCGDDSSGTQNKSCSQNYTYISNKAFPILPLTQNRTLIINYINQLKAFSTNTNGFFPSLISWGWRTIDPNWNKLWKVNTGLTSTLRSTGEYPRAYTGSKKSMILIFNGLQYWDDFAPNVNDYYINKCGNAKTVVNGLNHWWLTTYGMIPVPTDYINYVDDIACENRWYNTMDNTLGLNLTAAGNYKATVNTSTYASKVLNAVNAKFFRICNNIKAKNINVYLMAANNSGTLAPCCNTSSNAYTIGNSATSLTTALDAVRTKIVANLN